MKRILVGLFVVTVIVGLSSSGLGLLQAASPAQQATSAPQTWTPGTQVRISAGIPFVWLRKTPSSTASAVDTIRPGDVLVVVTASAPSAWDGTQWWWNVNRPGTAAYGWVEQDRVEPVPANMT